MPIRINLLAEQQAAEDARRRDPVKRTLVIGVTLVVATLMWTLMTHMQVKARRAELANLDTSFKQIDEKAKAARTLLADIGDMERRIVSLDRYSTNRMLWASMLDGMQRTTVDQVRLKSISVNQRYVTNGANLFFTTNISVPFDQKAPAWKFWAGNPQPTPVTDIAAKSFNTFTNSGAFSTNKLPYKVATSIVSTNINKGEVVVKCDFTLVAVTTEDIEIFIAGGDYGNPPGMSIDEYARQILNLPYFQAHLTKSDDRLRFPDRPPNAEMDQSLPNTPMYKRFTMRLKYADRVLINE
ncbi:MAG TPA: hypothetical protein VM680_09840 [Verrucomicrobiae bacterium]|nr:hypothetical protein [Verrucomicrobiae bacterium]